MLILLFDTVRSLFFIAAFMPEDSVSSSNIHDFSWSPHRTFFFIEIICDTGIICGPGSSPSLYTVFKHRFLTCVGLSTVKIRHVIFKNRFGEIPDPITRVEVSLLIRLTRDFCFASSPFFLVSSPPPPPKKKITSSTQGRYWFILLTDLLSSSFVKRVDLN